MEPQELSDEVGKIVELAQMRVGPGSIGAQQYHVPGKPQKFETMSWDQFCEYILEEALDIVNYGVMLSVRIRRMRNLINAHGIGDQNVVPDGTVIENEEECGKEKFLSMNLGTVICALPKDHRGACSFDIERLG